MLRVTVHRVFKPLLGSLLVLLFLGPLQEGRAQPYEELAVQYSRPHIFHEPLLFPADPQAVVAISFRIPNPLLVFLRNGRATPGRAFVAAPEVTVQVYQEGRWQATRIWRQPHFAAAFEDTQHPGGDAEGRVYFSLPAGTYTYRLLFNDRQAERESKAETRSFSVPMEGKMRVGSLLVAHQLQKSEVSLSLEPVNLGGAIPYGEDVEVLLPVGLPAGADPQQVYLAYTLHREGGEAAEGASVVRDTLPTGTWLPVRWTQQELPSLRPFHWFLDGTQPRSYLVPLDLDTERLEEGPYRLEVTLGGDEAAAFTVPIHVLWPDKPYALYASDLAIRMLHFMEDRHTIRRLRRGTEADKAIQLKVYWKQRDPTPRTPYNELMAEYYRRIDHAAFAFRTGRSVYRDGLHTDRAPIYIMHGPPETIEQAILEAGGLRETWTYPDGRRFVFWAATSLDPPRLRSPADY